MSRILQEYVNFYEECHGQTRGKADCLESIGKKMTPQIRKTASVMRPTEGSESMLLLDDLTLPNPENRGM